MQDAWIEVADLDLIRVGTRGRLAVVRTKTNRRVESATVERGEHGWHTASFGGKPLGGSFSPYALLGAIAAEVRAAAQSASGPL